MFENPHKFFYAMANIANNRTMRIGSIPLQFPPAVAREKHIYSSEWSYIINICASS